MADEYAKKILVSWGFSKFIEKFDGMYNIF